MKFSIALAAAAAAAALAVMAGTASAVSYPLNAGDPNAIRTCTANGGTVTTDPNGGKICSTGPACAMSVTPMPYVLNANDPNAVRACTDACGTVSRNASGQQICVKPMREPPNSN